MGLAALLTVLFFMSTATPQAATKNTTTWKVKVNEKYSGTLTLDGTQWYLNCSKVNFKRLNYLRRIVHLQTPKGCKITTGYYYFNTQGRLDRRRTFHDLDTRIGSTRFKGTYCFGEVNGRLHQQYGWYRVGGVNYGIGPTGKLPWHPEEKRSVRTEQLRQRLVCLCKRLKDQQFPDPCDRKGKFLCRLQQHQQLHQAERPHRNRRAPLPEWLTTGRLNFSLTKCGKNVNVLTTG